MAVIPDRRGTGISAELVPSPGCVDVVRHEEIEFAVTVEIEERAPRAPAAVAGSARFGETGVGDLLEPAATDIAIERVGSDVGDIQIDLAVVVVVARACAHPVLAMTDTRGCRHVFECAVPAIPEQPVARALGDGWICERAAVHKKDVEPAVIIEVEEKATRSEEHT